VREVVGVKCEVTNQSCLYVACSPLGEVGMGFLGSCMYRHTFRLSWAMSGHVIIMHSRPSAKLRYPMRSTTKLPLLVKGLHQVFNGVAHELESSVPTPHKSIKIETSPTMNVWWPSRWNMREPSRYVIEYPWWRWPVMEASKSGVAKKRGRHHKGMERTQCNWHSG
jgi:hypothetical protein